MKIVSILIGLLLITHLAFAAPIYTVEEVIDKIEILEHGNIQARKCRRVYRDGELISKSYIDRYVFTPDQDITKIKIQKVKDIANVVWTLEVVTKYKEEQAARALRNQ